MSTATDIRYVWSGSDDVAWSQLGDGDPVLVGGWWMSHLQRDWDYPPFRGFVEAIARFRRVIRMDPPGSGLSRSRPDTPATLDPHVEAMLAVLDAADAGRATLFAGSSGCAVAIAFAARHPDRVRRLVLSGAYLHGASVAAPADRAALVELVRSSWGVSSRVMSDIFYPDATAEQRRAYARHQRSTATPEAAAAGLQAVYSFDARAEAGAVRAPTLVLHRRGDRAIRLALGAETAAAIAGAHLEVLDGSDHHPWHGDSETLLRRALAFDGVSAASLGAGGLTSAGSAAHQGNGDSPLSDRELEVLLLVSRGLTDAQIAAELFLSVHTVHRHVANARTKLGVPSRAAAAAWAVSHRRS
ncbi:alpha/beta fold hydrolase [Microbacterium atlanticum]|uniref:alpha/beta fold hydrolase n=1 Tax=Microbacterium atlanticum TaxID=2782168 RepID=UPI001E56DEB2|nr:alpha/beta fold hydrolase [Microbacterium atlanticum]